MNKEVNKKLKLRFSFLEILMFLTLVVFFFGFVHYLASQHQVTNVNAQSTRLAENNNTQEHDAEPAEVDIEESASFKAGSRAMTLPDIGMNTSATSATFSDLFSGDAQPSMSNQMSASEKNNPIFPGMESGTSMRQYDAHAEIAGSDFTNKEAGLSSNTNHIRDIRAEVADELRRISEMEWGPGAESKLQGALGLWASIDPFAALDYALNIESRRTSAIAANTVLANWAKRDPQAAFEWYMQNRANYPEKLDNTVGDLFTWLADANLESALARLKELPSDSLRSKALKAIINDYVAKGEASRLEYFFISQQDASALSMLAAAQIDSIALYKPEAAAAWIATLTDPNIRVKAINTLIDKWGFDNPAKAAQWVAGLPQDEYWSEFASRMTRIWARDFPDNAATWLLSLSPPSPQLDTAIQTLVSIVMKANPAAAMAWANVITDLNKKYNLMQRAGYLWLKKDPAPATAYILNSDLPENIKNKLLGKR